MTGNPLDILAHELRSPIAALTAIAEAYRDANAVRRARLLELAAAAVAAIERLLLDEVSASLRREPTDLGALARDAADAAAIAGAPVVAEAEAGLVVRADAQRLRQALDNLIGNALGHAPQGTAVRVRARRAGETVVLEVCDEGDGIAPTDLESVFVPGVRLTDARPGEGLGLAVVRSIARAHGGEVEVESALGEGTTFRLVLPGASALP